MYFTVGITVYYTWCYWQNRRLSKDKGIYACGNVRGLFFVCVPFSLPAATFTAPVTKPVSHIHPFLVRFTLQG